MESKTHVQATTVSVEEDRAASEEAVVLPERRLKQAIWAIVGGVALPCIPIIVITAVLLYFIFHFRVDLTKGLPEFAPTVNETHRDVNSWIDYIRHQGGAPAYFVDYNPSTLTTIASWTSRVIPYLSSSIMALVAFFSARHIVLKSKHGDEHGSHLPTPEQLSLLINMLNGNGFSPLKDTILHRYRKREKLISPLPAAFTALFFITMLGLAIPIVDSWFGIATKPFTIQQLTPNNANISSFGRAFNYTRFPSGPRDNGTVNSNNPFNEWWPVTLFPANGHGSWFLDLYDTLSVAYGISKEHKIHNYTDPSGIEYLYIGDTEQGPAIDFQAKTFGVSAQCIPMTQLCYSNFAGNGGYLFNCTPAFGGNLWQNFLNSSATLDDAYGLPGGGPNVGVAFAENPELTVAGGQTYVAPNGWLPEEGMTLGNNVTKIYPTNPLYYGAWGVEYPASNFGSDDNLFVGDTGLFWTTQLGGGATWVFNCSTTVWDIHYTWVNGSVHTFNKTLASTDMAGLFSAPPAFAAYNPVIQNAIAEAASVAAYSGNNSRIIATRFAREFSRTMLALATAVMAPETNELEQIREPLKIVARIPLAPLYLLLATKALYVFGVVILAIGAYCFTHPAETEVVKAQLSVKGLTAAHFNQPGMVQQNVVRQLQDRIDAAQGKGSSGGNGTSSAAEKEPATTTLRHAATEPVQGSPRPTDNARVGLMPTAEGGWEFVVLANGVWNSIKPIVKTFVLQEAAQGELGGVGKAINAWH
ncbi:uncharacterized protein HMPREF1541_08525 [Cyphellophora europaea CBS 101466]|uniref:Uncharacterized protein n=1 Tax=Cyphellophora europaea (strain CBS 101466) TaxID=1220924 RepID=W2RKK3_CYPE1|nr:uncharacterized protein HMPREF1541_08525 [Cyphellophora europaea CBS 101466]ETN36248.1 hypothetical protein HMPREF1541_08525 [Cyphellophora europaea CBS 101466]